MHFHSTPPSILETKAMQGGKRSVLRTSRFTPREVKTCTHCVGGRGAGSLNSPILHLEAKSLQWLSYDLKIWMNKVSSRETEVDTAPQVVSVVWIWSAVFLGLDAVKSGGTSTSLNGVTPQVYQRLSDFTSHLKFTNMAHLSRIVASSHFSPFCRNRAQFGRSNSGWSSS